MPEIVPTVTAYSEQQYHQQLQLIHDFSKRVHIDLMDGEFAPTRSLPLADVWWPDDMVVDLHLMHQRPMETLDTLLRMKRHPRLVIVHNEADVHHMQFAAELHKEDILVGLAVLQDTPIEWTEQIMHSFDHVLIFSGNLGHHGGEADMNMLKKVAFLHDMHPEVEVGWDGGIDENNALALVDAGVQVLNVGGGIHRASDPAQAYATLSSLIH